MASDSRLSDPEGILIDQGVKISEIPLICRSAVPETGFFTNVYFANTLALGCLGGSLIYQQIQANLLPLLRNLIGLLNSVPSVGQSLSSRRPLAPDMFSHSVDIDLNQRISCSSSSRDGARLRIRTSRTSYVPRWAKNWSGSRFLRSISPGRTSLAIGAAPLTIYVPKSWAKTAPARPWLARP
jgi:hypothetical protein